MPSSPLAPSPYERYYEIAGITVRVMSDIPIKDSTFAAKFKPFQVNGPGANPITLRHHFELPEWAAELPGREMARYSSWIAQKDSAEWMYALFPPGTQHERPVQIVTFSDDHANVTMFSNALRAEVFRSGNLESLSAMPSDQMFLVPALAKEPVRFIHSAGAILNGKGLVFAGQAGAGKSTTVKMIRSTAEILSDDRVVIRSQPEGFRVYGSWDHGEVPLVSPSSAPLHAVLFLQKATENRLVRLEEPGAILSRLLVRLVKPPRMKVWWDYTLPLAESLVRQVPCYDLQFDKTGKVVKLLEEFCK